MSTTYNAFTCILNTNTSTICMVILCIYHYIEYIVLNTLCVYVDIYIYIYHCMQRHVRLPWSVSSVMVENTSHVTQHIHSVA